MFLLFRADQVVERLWKVNHWLCSHDNIWCTTSSFANLVKLAVERKREEEQDLAVMTAAGQWAAAPVAVVPELKREMSKAKEMLGEDSEPQDLQSTYNFIMKVMGSDTGPKVSLKLGCIYMMLSSVITGQCIVYVVGCCTPFCIAMQYSLTMT